MIKANIQVSRFMQLIGTFQAPTLEEAIAMAEMEARNNSEVQSQNTVILSSQSLIEE